MAFIQELVAAKQMIQRNEETDFKRALMMEAKKLISKTVVILPTPDTDPSKGHVAIVKDIASGENFYGKPLFVIVTDNGARLPVFSHNEIEVVESV